MITDAVFIGWPRISLALNPGAAPLVTAGWRLQRGSGKPRRGAAALVIPDFAALNPGYECAANPHRIAQKWRLHPSVKPPLNDSIAFGIPRSYGSAPTAW